MKRLATSWFLTDLFMRTDDMIVRFLVTVPEYVEANNDRSWYRDVAYKPFKVNISSHGLSLKINIPYPEKDAKRYLCQKPSFVNPKLFAPNCLQLLRGTNDSYAQDSKQAIYRVRNTMIGKVNVSEVVTGNGVLELFSIRLPDNGTSIRYTDVKYFDANTRQPVDHRVEFTELEEEYAFSVYVAKQTMTYEIFYRLTPTTIFRTFHSSDGFHLRVGSKPLRQKFGKSQIWTCEYKKETRNLKEFFTEIKIKVTENDVLDAVVSADTLITTTNFFTDFWSCRSNSTQETFLRVINYFAINEPVHSIDTYDGAEILVDYVKPSDETKSDRTLEIYEIKYLHNGTTPVRFEGVLYLKPTYMVYETSFSVGEYSVAIKKDEIVPLFTSQIPTRKVNLKDYEWNGFEYEKFEIAGGTGDPIMNFSVRLDTSHTQQPLLLVCELLNSTKLLPYFEILDSDTLTKIEKMSTEENLNLNSEYFEDVVRRTWLCEGVSQVEEKSEEESGGEADAGENGEKDAKEPNSEFRLYRAVTRRTLKKSTPRNISEIHHTPMDRVWMETTDKNDNGYELRMRSVRYYNVTTKQLYNYGGYVIYEDKARNASWRSGTKQLKKLKSEKTEELLYIDYEQDEYRMHKIRNIHHGRGRGRVENYDLIKLKVGSKWTKQYPRSDIEMTCEEDAARAKSEEEKETSLFHTQVVVTKQVDDENRFDQFFVRQYLRVWNCTNPEDENDKIVRVMNKFSFNQTKPDFRKVETLYYYDGVSFLIGINNDFYNESMEFTEIKYLDPIDLQALKFEGKLTCAPDECQNFRVETVTPCRFWLGNPTDKILKASMPNVTILKKSDSNEYLPIVMKEKDLKKNFIFSQEIVQCNVS
ncbi:hypothetical protein LSTR_LSTR011355 [Laodelphax striatellus]|uniref:Uncharacterized protein n=1 Tax=Laodelphax striatellus TaxID=195883 RepID=A0A482XIY9_LAOST|nr:hypothetical protein LSTR_LSTR011355 [Laodelphax striatellus]